MQCPSRIELKRGRTVSPRIPLTQDANCSTPSLPAGATHPCTQKHPFIRTASSAAAVTLLNCSPMSAVYWRPIQPPESFNSSCCDAIIYFHCLIYVSIIQKDADSRNHLCLNTYTRLLILMSQLINNVLYLLLVNFGSICDAEIDGLNVPATHSQVEGTAFGLVQIVDVQVSLVAKLHPCQ